MPIKLICEFARPNEQVFTQPVIKVGKLSSSHYLIEHKEVSRMHAVIEKDDAGYCIIDLGSHSGTKVNGKKVNKARIENASIIELGKVVIHAYTEEVDIPDPIPRETDLSNAYFGVRKTLQKIVDAKNRIARKRVIGEAGGGLVKVEFDGTFTPISVFVDPLALEDAKMVEDLMCAALIDAHKKFEKLAESTMEEM